MSNDFFNHTSTLSKNTLAKAGDVNSIFTSVAAGFALLPSKNSLHRDMLTYAADSGAADALVVALPKTLTAYTAGLRVRTKVNATNTGAATINVDSLGVRSIKLFDGTDPAAGDLTAGDFVELTYDGTNFVMADMPRSVASGLSDLSANLTFSGSVTFTGSIAFENNAVGGSAGASFSLLHAANDSFTLVAGGTSNASAQLRLHGSAHTNANDFSLRANTGTTVVGWDHSATTLTLLDSASDTLDIVGQTIDLSAAGAVTIQTTGAYNLVLGVNNTAAITIDDATTDVTFAADIDVTSLIKVGGAQVLTAPQTGWSAATGTADRNGFATGSATTQQVAEHLKALIDDLLTHGLIAA